MKKLLSILADNRASIASWLGLALLAQGVSAATARPEVVWPVALGIGALADACVATAVDWIVARAARQPAKVVK